MVGDILQEVSRLAEGNCSSDVIEFCSLEGLKLFFEVLFTMWWGNSVVNVVDCPIVLLAFVLYIMLSSVDFQAAGSGGQCNAPFDSEACPFHTPDAYCSFKPLRGGTGS